MEQIITIGLDIAKHVFQAHGMDAVGHVLFRKRLRREKYNVSGKFNKHALKSILMAIKCS